VAAAEGVIEGVEVIAAAAEGEVLCSPSRRSPVSAQLMLQGIFSHGVGRGVSSGRGAPSASMGRDDVVGTVVRTPVFDGGDGDGGGGGSGGGGGGSSSSGRGRGRGARVKMEEGLGGAAMAAEESSEDEAMVRV
jgi:hypothetical protein